MPSHFSSLGFDIGSSDDLGRLLRRLRPEFHSLGTYDGVEVLRFEDTSGARLVVGVRGRSMPDLLPSFAGRHRVELAGCRLVGDDVFEAEVLDERGEVATMIRFELEQQRALRGRGAWSGWVALSAIAEQPQVWSSEDEFLASGSTLASRAFISSAMLGGAEPRAEGMLVGHVMDVERRWNEAGTAAFVVSRVATYAMELDVVSSVDQPIPVPGGIMATTAFLVASADELLSR